VVFGPPEVFLPNGKDRDQSPACGWRALSTETRAFEELNGSVDSTRRHSDGELLVLVAVLLDGFTREGQWWS
jgi:hypothetical protein